MNKNSWSELSPQLILAFFLRNVFSEHEISTITPELLFIVPRTTDEMNNKLSFSLMRLNMWIDVVLAGYMVLHQWR